MGAEASQCAAKQGAFWEYHDYLYENVRTPLTRDKLQGAAAAVGLNAGTFDTCLSDGQTRDYIGNDYNAAVAAGARGTPTFLINGQAVSPQPAEMIAAIEAILNQ